MESFLNQIAAVWRPHPGQRQFLLAEATNRVLACGRRWGKTEACAADVVARLQRGPPSRQLLVAPTLAQAQILFRRVTDLLAKIGCMLGKNEVRRTPFPSVEFEGHSVVARSGHHPDSLRGDEADHVIVDEAAFVPEELITESLWPMLATTAGRLTLISTPNGLNHFWRFFEMGQRGEGGFWSRRAPSRENPRVSPEFLDAQKAQISARSFATEYEASFADAANVLISQENIDRAKIAQLPDEVRGETSIGIDWAQTQDHTAVAVLQGRRDLAYLVECTRVPRGSWRDLVLRAAAIVLRYPGARVLCDSTGLGNPVTERLRERLPNVPVQGFDFNARSRWTLVEGLAELFERAAIRFRPNPTLESELNAFSARRTDSGSIRYEARGSAHDDLVMALALAAHNLPAESRLGIRLG